MTWGKAIPWILLVVIALLFFFYAKGCFTPHVTDREGELKDSVFFWRDSAGKAVASLREKAVDYDYIKKRFKDSIAALLQTKADNLQEIINLKEHGQTTIYVPGQAPPAQIKYVDTGHKTIASVSQVFTNPWYQAVAEISLEDNTKSQLQLQTFDTLLLAWKTVKTGNLFTRKKFLQLDIRNSNPYNQVTHAQAYRVPPVPPKKWGIGLFVGWGYEFNATGNQWGAPIIGVGVQRTFIRF